MIAALYVQTDGCYYGLPHVEPWDQARDARLYAGPYPVVAHPPCERWGRYWGGSPTTFPRLKKGDDGGCFKAALAAVRTWGGILEHPEGSAAWHAHGLVKPPRSGGWIPADHMLGFEGWTCCVEQGAYGHKARKATWLYAHGVALPNLKWGRAPGDFLRPEDGYHSAEERRRAIKTGVCQRLSKRQRAATPLLFRDLLLSIAASAIPQRQHHPKTRLPRPSLQGHPLGLPGHVLPGHPGSGAEAAEVGGGAGDDGQGHDEITGSGLFNGDIQALHVPTLPDGGQS